ncbi:MAG: hypothetical protein ACUZ8I_12235 [Candidatus Scalindua sp.]
MESKEYWKYHFSKAWKDTVEHLREYAKTEIPSAIATIGVGIIVGVKIDEMVISILTAFGGLVILFLYLLFNKWMNVSKHLYEEKLSLEGQQRPKLKVIFKQGIRPWVKEERGKLVYEFVKSILQTSVRYRGGQSFGKDKGYKFTLIQPDGR